MTKKRKQEGIGETNENEKSRNEKEGREKKGKRRHNLTACFTPKVKKEKRSPSGLFHRTLLTQ